MKRPEGDAPWEEYHKYILYLENDNKLLETSSDKLRTQHKEALTYIDVLKDEAVGTDKKVRELKMYVKVTRDAFLEDGFATNSFVIKQADKLLK